MNRKLAKQIKLLAKVSNKSEKSLKREYYKLNSRERFLFKRELEKALDTNGKDKI